jgi:hypothetical protein
MEWGIKIRCQSFPQDAYPAANSSHLFVSTDHSWTPRTDETFLVPSLHGPSEQLRRFDGAPLDPPATATTTTAEHSTFSGQTPTGSTVGNASEEQPSTIVWRSK